jgi:cytoskeletal protein CcmA (bactofilin family)
MFTKNKGAESSPSRDMPKPSASQDAIRGASSKSASRVASIICEDMKINGSVMSHGALHIDGTVDGDVQAVDITIGASGHITGEVKAEVVKVKGKVKGSIRARKVELESGAHVKGDIVHASLQIQSNAVFEGQVKHSDDPLKDSAPRAAESTSGKSSGSPTAFGIPTTPS